jgi:hypothetical protein
LFVTSQATSLAVEQARQENCTNLNAPRRRIVPLGSPVGSRHGTQAPLNRFAVELFLADRPGIVVARLISWI